MFVMAEGQGQRASYPGRNGFLIINMKQRFPLDHDQCHLDVAVRPVHGIRASKKMMDSR